MKINVVYFNWKHYKETEEAEFSFSNWNDPDRENKWRYVCVCARVCVNGVITNVSVCVYACLLFIHNTKKVQTSPKLSQTRPHHPTPPTPPAAARCSLPCQVGCCPLWAPTGRREGAPLWGSLDAWLEETRDTPGATRNPWLYTYPA